jgi:3-methyladenine DNA glycosylase AlkD
MNTKEILAELKKKGTEATKNTWLRHGAREPVYGVSIEDLKNIGKRVREDRQQIALALFASGVGDAMYLAGLMADGSKMTEQELDTWAQSAEWPMVSEYTVAWVAAENAKGWDLALQWINSKKENIASSGWATLSGILATRPDEQLDLGAIGKLLERVENEITRAPNRVRYCMNGFVIATGSYVKTLSKQALATGKKIGEITVDMGGTSCKVPFAPLYIKKVLDRGALGKKRKTVKC